MYGHASEPFRVAWGSFDDVVETTSAALRPGPFLLGDWYTAADVMVGSAVQWGTVTKLLPERAELSRYLDTLAQRPALARAFRVDEQAAKG